jgi:hypothetical protein
LPADIFTIALMMMPLYYWRYASCHTLSLAFIWLYCHYWYIIFTSQLSPLILRQLSCTRHYDDFSDSYATFSPDFLIYAGW